MADKQIDQAELDGLRQELEKKKAEAEAKGLPFNQNAYLRRMAQGKNQYYDSAEYVLRNGWGGQQQKQAYFDQNIHNTEQQKQSMNSRFRSAPTTAEDEDDDE